eukprot:692858-Hanusia_phi.AAC.1
MMWPPRMMWMVMLTGPARAVVTESGEGLQLNFRWGGSSPHVIGVRLLRTLAQTQTRTSTISCDGRNGHPRTMFAACDRSPGPGFPRLERLIIWAALPSSMKNHRNTVGCDAIHIIGLTIEKVPYRQGST